MKSVWYVRGGKHKIYVRVDSLVTREMIRWLNAYEGIGSYARDGYGIYFASEQDAVMFSLRWL